MKLCRECKIEKEDGCFYPHRAKCKSCFIKKVIRYPETAKRYYIRNRIRLIAYQKTYNAKHPRQIPHQNNFHIKAWKKAGAKTPIQNSKAWIAKNPEKRKAHFSVQNAVRTGKLKKPDKCSSCGCNKRLHAHHSDYAKPLIVEWLCAKCHKKKHAQKI